MDSGADPHHLGGVSQGRDVTFLVEELRSVFDPKGLLEQGQVRTLAYRRNWQRDRNPSHRIGMLKVAGLDEHQQAFLADKQAELQARQQADEQQAGSGFHPVRRFATSATARRWYRRMAA